MLKVASRRRAFLKSFAAAPGLGFLGGFAGCSTPTSEASGRDVIAELGVRKFINAAGTYTSLTASQMPPEVMAAINVARDSYCPLNDLHDAAGKRIAELCRVEAAMVSAGCASALSLATAACVAGDDPEKIKRIPDTDGMKNEVIIQAGHRLGYDHAIRNCGINLIEIETRADLDAAINENTAMMAFINTKTPEGKIGRAEWVEVAKNHEIPTLIDAAADVPPVENLWRFTDMGFDLAAFSGGKGLRGPQSAGLLLGRSDLIAAARMNNSPNGDSLCRTNKVNKEELVGMLVALELYVEQDHDAVWADWEDRCATIAAAAQEVEGVETEVFVPEIANHVPHLRVTWDYEGKGLQPEEAAEKLRQGSPSIEVRPGSKGAGALEIAVWMMNPEDVGVVARRVRETLAG